MEFQRKKMKREKPNKKWRDEEIKIILNYLQEASQLEAPTAQIFYKKLIAETGVQASWDLIRWKVRHLKSTFQKANDWRKSTGAGLLESDVGTSCVDGKVLQMCPHYHQLNEIFGQKSNDQSAYEASDTGDSTAMDESNCYILNEPMPESPLLLVPKTEFVEISADVNINFPSEIYDNQSNGVNSPVQAADDSNESQSGSTAPKKAKDFAEKLKKLTTTSASSHLAAFQAERTAMVKMKFEWEKEKYYKEVAMNERKIKLREVKTKANIDLKKRELELRALEMETNERLRILEIEKDERVRKFEIEMKYKYNTNT